MRKFLAEDRNSLHSHKRIDIQALRGISVLAVIIFHASNRILPNGYLGVDIFFVVSGFVVTPLLLRIFIRDTENSTFKFSKDELSQFFKKRFLRLAPALGATLVTAAILAMCYLPPKDLGRFSGQGLATLSLLGNFGAFHYVGDYFYPNPNPLVHTWSLSTEEQIYLLIPFILLLVFRVKGKVMAPNKILSRTYLFLGIFSFFSFFLVGTISRHSNNAPAELTNFNFYSVSSRFWEFAIGGAISFYLKSDRESKYQQSGILKVIATLGISVVLCWRSPIGTPYGELLACVSAGAFICLTSPSFKKPQLPLAWIGDRSYSLYLIHMPLIYLAYYSPHWSDGFNRRSGKVVAVLLTFALGFALYELVEKKYRVTGGGVRIPFSSIKKALPISFLAPLAILLILFIGSSGNFYGFDKNPRGPIDPGSLDSACYLQLGAQPCIYGDTSPNIRYALLVGDSHARHLTIGFSEAAKSVGFTPVIWTQSGCQFVFRNSARNYGWQKLEDAWGRRQYAEKQSCFEHNDQISAWVQSHPNASIFVTQRSTSYPANDFGVDLETYLKSNLRDIRTLKLSSNKVTVIGPNPEFADLTRFFAGNTLLWEKPYEVTTPRKMRKTEMIQNPFIDDQFMKTEVPKLGMEYLSTIDIFCNKADICSRFQDGKWLYANADHLSIAGSRLVKTSIIGILQRS